MGITVNQLYEYLRRYALSDSLYIIGLINASMKYGTKGLAQDGIQPPVIAWINANYKTENERRQLLIMATRLARFLILSGTNDHKDKYLDIGPVHGPILTRALAFAMNVYDPDIEPPLTDPLSVARSMGRMIQWQFPLQVNRQQVIGRAVLLFRTIPSTASISYNIDEKLKECIGIGTFEFITSGICLWMSSNGKLENDLQVEVPALKGKITDDSLRTFIRHSSGTVTQYRSMIRGEDWLTMKKLYDVYALDPFLKMPAIRVEHSRALKSGSYIIPQPLYLLQRASSGIFYLLADYEQANALAKGQAARNDFRLAFGDVIYRTYVRKMLEQARHPLHFIDIDEIPDTVSGRKPDFAIIENDICVLFEVKTGLLTINARTYLEEGALRTEVQKPSGSIAKAISQLNTYESRILQGSVPDPRFAGVTKIVKVIVGYEDVFVANAALVRLIEEVYGAAGKGFQIATISDIDEIGMHLGYEADLGTLMLEKVTSYEHKWWAIINFLHDRNRGKGYTHTILEAEYDAFMNGLMGKVV